MEERLVVAQEVASSILAPGIKIMTVKEIKMQLALGLAQECTRCHKIKILQDFATMEAEDGLPEISSETCRQCFEEEVKALWRARARASERNFK